MMHFDFDGPALPAEVKRTGKVLRVVHTIVSHYSERPETQVRGAILIGEGADQKVMTFKADADKFHDLLLIQPNDTVEVGASNFDGAVIHLRSLRIRWSEHKAGFRKPGRTAASGMILRKGIGLRNSFGRAFSYCRIAILVEMFGSAKVISFTTESDDDAFLCEVGDSVYVDFEISERDLEVLYLKDLQLHVPHTDWIADGK